jgi:hypothetical protein
MSVDVYIRSQYSYYQSSAISMSIVLFLTKGRKVAATKNRMTSRSSDGILFLVYDARSGSGLAAERDVSRFLNGGVNENLRKLDSEK